jgi:hypothetical protein
MAVDSHTSATTSAAPAQPDQRPSAAAPPAAGAPMPSPAADPARAPGASPAAPSSGSPATEVAPASPASGDRAAADPQAPAAAEQQTGFGSRGRRRRRARFLRKARELAYRDLGGLVFSLHRFGQRNDPLVLAKLATLSRIDAELRALEDSLGERQPVTVLREAGITACPRCAAIHSGEDRFCPSCGLSMSRRSDLPIAGAAAGGAARTSPPPAGSPPAGSPLAGAPLTTHAPPATPQPPPGGAAANTGAAPSTGPATQQHAALPATGAHAQPSAAPQPATQAFDAVPPDRGDQPTEIIRPPAPGS